MVLDKNQLIYTNHIENLVKNFKAQWKLLYRLFSLFDIEVEIVNLDTLKC